MEKNKDVGRQLTLWIGALIVGGILGLLGLGWLDQLMTFIATVYTRLFQLVAVPTIVLAVITTLAKFGEQKDTGRIFGHAVTYTLLTTITAAAVGLILYNIFQPGNLPASMVNQGNSAIPKDLGNESYYDHILDVIPNNILKPLLDGNVLSLLILAFAVGIALAKMPKSDRKDVLMKGILGLQDLLFLLIHALIWSLPLGILAFSAQLTAQVSAGIAAESLGKYIAVIVSGNLIQIFIILPLFLLARGLNPLHVFARMSPAVLMAFFTKSSAATLPVTMASAENRLGVSEKVSRFVLPICTTINMNGCAAFILVTSLFHAEWRRGILHRTDDSVAFHSRHCGNRQCRSTDGLLFPHFVADDRYRRACRNNGNHPSRLHHLRHDRDRRECLVRLLRLRNDRPRHKKAIKEYCHTLNKPKRAIRLRRVALFLLVR